MSTVDAFINRFYYLCCPSGHYSMHTTRELTASDGTYLCPECGKRTSITAEQAAKLRKLNELQRREAT